jgi:glutamate N-acetyltransferase/amino-acid N-acetyltransferase
MTTIPNGFRFAGVHCGIKRASDAEDIALIVADQPCVAAGVYTKNQVVAAPVTLDRQRTPGQNIRAVIVNSGNANACTGDEGMRNAKRMAAATAKAIGAAEEQILVMSTGIIGEQLQIDKIETGIRSSVAKLGRGEENFLMAARGFITTDTKIKTAFRTIESLGIEIAGIAKGSGMIGPNMATMLSTILTNAAISPDAAQRLLSQSVEKSFNSINVDGHTSTNDTVLLLASGKGITLAGPDLDAFRDELQAVCIDLAKQIVQDGEGATHLVEISITGAASNSDARTIAEAIANSPLVKTAIAGNDPNWGRIVSAAGYAGPKIDIAQTQLTLNQVRLFQRGTPVPFDAVAVSASMKDNRDVFIDLSVGAGDGNTRFWTCDLTHEYVTINAEYHT